MARGPTVGLPGRGPAVRRPWLARWTGRRLTPASSPTAVPSRRPAVTTGASRSGVARCRRRSRAPSANVILPQRRPLLRRPRPPRVLGPGGNQSPRRRASGTSPATRSCCAPRGCWRRSPGCPRWLSTRTTPTARAPATALTRTTCSTAASRSRTWSSMLTPFFVTRPVFAGAGRVGLGQRGERPGFQLSQRADFLEAEVGLETTLRRPIINTRDEPHADAERYRRLHVIVGDANMLQVATYLKLGHHGAGAVAAGAGGGPARARRARARRSGGRRSTRSATTSPSPSRSTSPTAAR